MSETKKKASNGKTYGALIAISFAYFGLYWLLMRETTVCDASKVQISSHWFHGFWDQYLACRSLNELGDALAGAFAPVAFIWLAGAVYIQSQELRAQREELVETQEVMRAQLEVAKQQVTETKASTALFQTQTDLMQAENKRKIQDEKIEETLIYITRLMINSDHYGACKRFNSTDQRWHPARIVNEINSNTRIEEIFDSARKTLEKIIFQHGNQTYAPYSVKHKWLELIKEHITYVLESEQNLSDSKKIRIMSLFLVPLAEQITILIEKVPEIEAAHQ